MISLPQDQNGRPDVDRAAINRQNATLSSGPKTEAGKKRSSLNARHHGLTSHIIVRPSEDLVGYQTFWAVNRASAMENNLLLLGFHNQADKIDTENPEIHAALAMALLLQTQTKALANISLHRDRLSRQFDRTLKQLREAQAERRNQESDALNQAASILRGCRTIRFTFN